MVSRNHSGLTRKNWLATRLRVVAVWAASDREASRHFYRVACLMASRLNVQGKHRTCCVDFTIESFLDGLNMALRRL